MEFLGPNVYAGAVRAFVGHNLFNDVNAWGDKNVTQGFATANEGLVGGFIYHEYNPEYNTIELSAYSSTRSWSSKENIRHVIGMPFSGMGVRMLVARHDERNTRVRRIWKALGAKETLIPDLREEGVAEVIATLKKEDFYNSKFMNGVTNG